MMIEYMKEAVGIEDRREKDEHWEKVQVALNRSGPPRKTIIQWKKIWRDMRCNTKKKLMEIKRTRPGSPCPVELNKEDHEIIEIVGAGSDYFEEGGEGRELMNFEYAQPEESLCDTDMDKSNIKEGKEPLDESAINIPTEKRRTIILPPPPADYDEPRNKLIYNTQKNSNSFGMDDKVLSTLLESIAAASKIQKQKKDLPDPDKLFLLSFVHALKKIPEDMKYDVKTDIINVFRKWQEVLGNGPPDQNTQGTSCMTPPSGASGSSGGQHHQQPQNMQHQHATQLHVASASTLHPSQDQVPMQRQENGGF